MLPPDSLPRTQSGTDCATLSRADLPGTSIVFCHPGYHAPFNKLFSLPRIESIANGPPPGQWGVQFLTALTACQIIANNAFNGYLAEQADGPQIMADNDSILTRNQYFFIVPEKPTYAIVPSFQEWQFPGSELIPRSWRDAVAATEAGDIRVETRCTVSGRFTIETAHLAPKEEKTWFLNNAMAIYDPHSTSSPSDCPSNHIVLDCSLHKAMDKRLWTFVPRHGRFAVQTISLPECLTNEMLGEFVYEYHGRHLRGMYQTQVEYLFARFAWTILYLVKGFLLMGRPKTILARYRVWDDGKTQVREEGLQPKGIDVLFGRGGTKSASPRKRSRASSEQSRGDDLEWGRVWGWLAPPCGETTVSEDEDEDEDEERGRKRTRDEDDTRYGKRRRIRASNSVSAVPSLAASGSHSDKSVSSGSTSPPRPGPSLQGHARPKNMDPNKKEPKMQLDPGPTKS